MLIYLMLLHSHKKHGTFRVAQLISTLPQHRASLADLRDILLGHHGIFLLLLPPPRSSPTHSFLPLPQYLFFFFFNFYPIKILSSLCFLSWHPPLVLEIFKSPAQLFPSCLVSLLGRGRGGGEGRKAPRWSGCRVDDPDT